MQGQSLPLLRNSSEPCRLSEKNLVLLLPLTQKVPSCRLIRQPLPAVLFIKRLSAKPTLGKTTQQMPTCRPSALTARMPAAPPTALHTQETPTLRLKACNSFPVLRLIQRSKNTIKPVGALMSKASACVTSQRAPTTGRIAGHQRVFKLQPQYQVSSIFNKNYTRSPNHFPQMFSQIHLPDYYRNSLV